MRECTACKLYWKGRRLTASDAQSLFVLTDEDLQPLPCKDIDSTVPDVAPVRMYAFATAAGAAVRKYGSIYHMVQRHSDQRDQLALQIRQKKSFPKDVEELVSQRQSTLVDEL